jgi:hypothetical protein
MRIVPTLAACLLCGCASDYAKFYRGVPDRTPDVVAKSRVSSAPKVPALERAGGTSAEIAAAYAKRGYAVMGYSSFTSGRRESDSAALAQGAEVGADIVVVIDPKYMGSISTTVPITTPTAATSYTSGSATAYGPGGPVTAYGNATTTTYGTQTNYVPLTIHRFNYGALYLFKRNWIFGALFRDLSDDERRAQQSNKGVYVTTLVDGSPAFNADVLPRDIVVAVDGQPVFGQQAFTDTLSQKRGRTVQLTIVRGAHTITKSVALAE